MGEYSLYNPSADQNQDSLAHYGRLGMKWYQHIYGEYQGAAKYAEKGKKIRDKILRKADEKYVKGLSNKGDPAKLEEQRSKTRKKARKLVEKMKEVEAVRDKAKFEKEAKENPLVDVDKTQHDKDLTARINKDYFSPDTTTWPDPPREEQDAAANLGLRVLKERGDFSISESDLVPDNESGARDWFLFDDQTIGMPTVAHLINKGNSAKDVKEFVRKVNTAHDTTKDAETRHSLYKKYFDLIYGDGLESFADDCEKVKQRESVKHYAVGSTKTHVGLNEYSLYNPDSELAHHGILGMKWGVRRYQNPDGSLTPLGRKRFARSRKNQLLNYYDKDSAKNIYKRKASEAKGVSKALSRMSQKEQKKADKLKDVDSEKSSQHSTLAKRYASNSEAYEKVSEMYDQKVKDIKSGLIKAGEDFIVQADVDWYGLFMVGTHQIITKPKNEAKKSDPLYDNVMETYEVSDKGKMLKSEHEKVKKIETKMADHQDNFYKKNPPESETFKKHLENRLAEMTTNDSDGEEIRKTIRDETSRLAKSGQFNKSNTGFEMAYADYCRGDSTYKKLNERLSKATDAYDAKAKKLATASYRKHGADAIDAWDPENVSQRAPKYAIDILAYLMKESCEGRR